MPCCLRAKCVICSQYNEPTSTISILDLIYPSGASMNLTFLHIGMAKAASTWLYRVYLEHPDIFTPPESDNPNFFSSQYHQGLGWYENQYFSTYNDEPVSGEFSNSYLISEVALERIAKHFPNVQLTCILRNPIERAYLHWAHAYYKGRRLTNPKTDSGNPIEVLKWRRRPRKPFQIPLEAVQHPNGWVYSRMFLEPGLYAFHLKRLVRYFPADQLYVALYDDLLDDPKTFLYHTFTFLGADPEFQPNCLHTDINPESKRADPNEMSEDLRAHIRNFYHEDIAELESILDRDLSAWQ